MSEWLKANTNTWPYDGRDAFNLVSESTGDIPEGCFSSLKNLRSIYILGKVSKIENQAFQNCRNLLTVELPTSYSVLGKEAFSSCDQLSNINLQSVKHIETECFKNTNLSGEIILLNVRDLGSRAFQNFSSKQKDSQGITKFNAPNLQNIGNECFMEQGRLKEVDIPSANIIGRGVFKGCSALQTVSGHNKRNRGRGLCKLSELKKTGITI